jgi:hypothetical protein
MITTKKWKQFVLLCPSPKTKCLLHSCCYESVIVITWRRERGRREGANHQHGGSRGAARIMEGRSFAATPKKEIAYCQSRNDAQENPTIIGHDGEHEQIAQSYLDAEQ